MLRPWLQNLRRFPWLDPQEWSFVDSETKLSEAAQSLIPEQSHSRLLYGVFATLMILLLIYAVYRFLVRTLIRFIFARHDVDIGRLHWNGISDVRLLLGGRVRVAMDGCRWQLFRHGWWWSRRQQNQAHATWFSLILDKVEVTVVRGHSSPADSLESSMPKETSGGGGHERLMKFLQRNPSPGSILGKIRNGLFRQIIDYLISRILSVEVQELQINLPEINLIFALDHIALNTVNKHSGISIRLLSNVVRILNSRNPTQRMKITETELLISWETTNWDHRYSMFSIDVRLTSIDVIKENWMLDLLGLSKKDSPRTPASSRPPSASSQTPGTPSSRKQAAAPRIKSEVDGVSQMKNGINQARQFLEKLSDLIHCRLNISIVELQVSDRTNTSTSSPADTGNRTTAQHLSPVDRGHTTSHRRRNSVFSSHHNIAELMNEPQNYFFLQTLKVSVDADSQIDLDISIENCSGKRGERSWLSFPKWSNKLAINWSLNCEFDMTLSNLTFDHLFLMAYIEPIITKQNIMMQETQSLPNEPPSNSSTPKISVQQKICMITYLLSQITVRVNVSLLDMKIITGTQRGQPIDISWRQSILEVQWDRMKVASQPSKRRNSIQSVTSLPKETLNYLLYCDLRLNEVNWMVDGESTFKCEKLGNCFNFTVPPHSLTLDVDPVSQEWLLLADQEIAEWFLDCRVEIKNVYMDPTAIIVQLRKSRGVSVSKKDSERSGRKFPDLPFVFNTGLELEIDNVHFILRAPPKTKPNLPHSLIRGYVRSFDVEGNAVLSSNGRFYQPSNSFDPLEVMDITIKMNLEAFYENVETSFKVPILKFAPEVRLTYTDVLSISGSVSPKLTFDPCFYICLFDSVIAIKQSIPSNDNSKAKTKSESKDLDSFVNLVLPRFDIDITLPHSVCLNVCIENLRGNIMRQKAEVSADAIFVYGIPKLSERPLFQIQKISFALPLKLGKDVPIHVRTELLESFVPYEYDFAAFVDNMSNMVRTIKQIHRCGRASYIGVDPSDLLPSPKNFTEILLNLPEIKLDVDQILFQLEDEFLDSRLNQVFRHALFEMHDRFNRETRFRRWKRKQTYITVSQSRMFDEIQQITNFQIWKNRISSVKEYPPLISFSATSFRGTLRSPKLPASTIEESLNMLDCETPADLTYDVLVGGFIDIRLQSFQFQVRDFPQPFIRFGGQQYIHEYPIRLRGLFLITEVDPIPENFRHIVYPLTGSDIKAHVQRALTPTKIYTALDIQLKGHHPGTSSFTLVDFAHDCVDDPVGSFTYGVHLEPHLADMNRRFSCLTPDPPDPSDKLPFWDKMRLMIHGACNLTVDNGCFLINIGKSRRAHTTCTGQSSGVSILMSQSMRFDIGRSTYFIPAFDPDFENVVLMRDLPESKNIYHFEIWCRSLSAGRPATKHTVPFLTEDTVAVINQGITLIADIGFDTPGNGNHSNVSLSVNRTPGVDSFAPVRSNSLTFDLQFKANINNSDELKNCISLNQQWIRSFMALSDVLTSKLSVIPVKRGIIFFPPPLTIPQPQKLSRYIKTILVRANLNPLLLDYTHHIGSLTDEVDNRSDISSHCLDDTQLLGIRVLMRTFSVAFVMRQQNFVPGQKGTGWDLLAADCEVTDFQVRVFSFGDNLLADMDDSVTSSSTLSDALDVHLDLENSNQTKSEWSITCGEGAMFFQDDSQMIPFCWVPRLVYYQNGSDTVFPLYIPDFVAPDRDDKTMQKYMLTKRLNELSIIIKRHSATIKRWEDRIAVYNDDVLAQQSKALVDQLAILIEKKTVLERLQEKPIEHTGAAHSHDPASKQSAKHRFHIQHLNIVWNTQIRNLVFQLADLERRGTATRLLATNTAIRIMRELIGNLSNRSSSSSQSSSQDGLNSSSQNNQPDFMINKKMAAELLSHLLTDRDENFVVTEGDNDPDSLNDSQGIRINDSRHPAYIPEGLHCRLDYQLQLSYPQFSFQTTSKVKDAGYWIITARRAIFNSSVITDPDADSGIEKSDDSESVNTLHLRKLVKRRHLISAEDAQFYMVFQMDALAKAGEYGSARYVSDIQWPVWVPLENLIEPHLPTEEFSRMVGGTNFQIQIDRANPLYVRSSRRDQHASILDAGPGFVGRQDEWDSIHLTHVNFPSIVLQSTSKQYSALCDLIGSLLVYNDPKRKMYLEMVQGMVFALMKTNEKDWYHILKAVEVLQRQTKLNRKMTETTILTGKFPANTSSIAPSLQLLILMDSMKRLASQQNQKNTSSVKQSSKILVESQKISWKILLDDGSVLCELSLLGASFHMSNYEDQSRMNNLEFDQLILVNCLPKPYYRALIAPYQPDPSKEIVLGGRYKMLRVYWRELAPVAGIAMMEHLEINLFPLVFQMTFEVAKFLMEYFYPKQRKNSKNAISASNSKSRLESNEAAGSENTIFRQSTANRTGPSESQGTNSDLRTRPQSRTSSSLVEQQSQNLDWMGSDVKLMKDRASSNRTFVYIKVPGSTHCVSYHGEKEKNIEDLDQFVLKLPTLEYHNKTWTWLEFMLQVRRDIGMAIFHQTGSFLREKLSRRRRKANLSRSIEFLESQGILDEKLDRSVDTDDSNDDENQSETGKRANNK